MGHKEGLMLHSYAKLPLIAYFATYFPTMRNCLTIYEYIVYLHILIFSDFPQIVLSVSVIQIIWIFATYGII